MRVAFYPIERVEMGPQRRGADDEDFDPTILPFDLGTGVTVEDITNLIPRDEFDVHKRIMGSDAHSRIERIRYALVHRYSEFLLDENGQMSKSEAEQSRDSRDRIRETAACLRLIRPTSQYLHLFEGYVSKIGMFTQISLDAPVDYIDNPINQRHFGVRTEDLEALRFYAPLFHNGMRGASWKFRMAVQMHESGCFQNHEWKAKYFLWTTAVEALFTTKKNQGSKLATERIKFFLGPDSLIYPPGELVSLYPDPKLTIKEVLVELYCLRNHIAHGDRVPDFYLVDEGRPGPFQETITKREVLFEALSFIIRQSLLKVLKYNLLPHFTDAAATDSYFGQYELSSLKLKDRPTASCP